MNTLYKKNVISMSDLNLDMIENILELATLFKQEPNSNILNNRLIASCFFEPSTRTRLSFEAAILRSGGKIIGLGEVNASSVAKGESLEDSIKVISSYVDMLLLRHPKEGIVKLATEYSSCPIINCGDGANQHPTQTLTDLFSIQECQGKLNNLHIAFVGDLKHGRTVNSLVKALSHFNTTFYFVAPDELQTKAENIELLQHSNRSYHLVSSIEDIIANVDIIYMTRLQKERFANKTNVDQSYENVAFDINYLKQSKPNLKILHPLPRLDEIPVNIDKTAQAYYFEQAKNGVCVRQALLSSILHYKKIKHSKN